MPRRYALQSHGLGWAVGDGWYGHGGANATDMVINTKQGLVLVYLMQIGIRSDNGPVRCSSRKGVKDASPNDTSRGPCVSRAVGDGQRS